MRDVCIICGKKVTTNRSSHLKYAHRIEPYKGAVREYFITEEEVRK